MAGVTSASMFMHREKQNLRQHRLYQYERADGEDLRMGANDQSVIGHLNWMRDVQGPMLRDAMKIIGED